MKVGTDGVLLGAWIAANQPQRILDIGTGCGLIALMLAQRFPSAIVDAVDIEIAAAEEARSNFDQSPWSNRLSAMTGDIRSIELRRTYSLIVTNPPWYDTEMKSTNPSRSLARHADALGPDDLAARVAELLDSDGRFCVILPIDKAQRLISAALDHELHLIRQTAVRPKPSKPAHRLLMEFSRQQVPHGESVPAGELIVETEVRHDYTPEFRSLLKDFFLRF